jgi:LysM repeat protein
MKMKTHLATLLVVLATTGPLLSATEVERLRALCDEQEMQIRQLELKISRLTETPPPSRSSPAAPPATSGARGFEPVSDDATYTVKSGDSIDRIASKHGTSALSLAKLNGLKADSIIHPGQKLEVPGKTSIADKETIPAPAKESRTHTVQSGETYYKISMRYGVSVDDLIAANPSINHRALRVGQKIRVDRAQKTVAKAPAPGASLASAPSIPIMNNPAPVEKPRASDRPIRIEKEITYGQFAKHYNTTSRRLDELNGLELDSSTVLAQGSELYIPAQP